jgi:phosphonoacetaldehyde hydrolase
VGVAETGNEMGFSEEELAALAPTERAARLADAHDRLADAGAHTTVDSVAACLPVLRELEARLGRGERP